MYKSGQPLRTSADFDNALLFALHVEVWQQGEIIDYGGSIEVHTEHSVTINGAKYLKAVCEFKVR